MTKQREGLNDDGGLRSLSTTGCDISEDTRPPPRPANEWDELELYAYEQDIGAPLVLELPDRVICMSSNGTVVDFSGAYIVADTYCPATHHNSYAEAYVEFVQRGREHLATTKKEIPNG